MFNIDHLGIAEHTHSEQFIKFFCLRQRLHRNAEMINVEHAPGPLIPLSKCTDLVCVRPLHARSARAFPQQVRPAARAPAATRAASLPGVRASYLRASW